MRKAMIAMLSISVLFAGQAFAVDVEPQFIPYGEIKGTDHGDPFVDEAIAGRLKITGGGKFFWSVTLEAWKVLGKESRLPNTFFAGSAEIGPPFKWGRLDINPTVGFTIGQFDRDGNPKYERISGSPNENWTRIKLIFGSAGINPEYRFNKEFSLYGAFHLLFPLFWQSDVYNSSLDELHEPHGRIEVGIKYRQLRFGLFRTKYSFDQIQNNIYLQGLVVGVRF
jgi:opacity protein-like surface antigen